LVSQQLAGTIFITIHHPTIIFQKGFSAIARIPGMSGGAYDQGHRSKHVDAFPRHGVPQRFAQASTYPPI
jgi:hypothetical protein